MSSIGFIGLGNMGLPMVLNLIKAGHSVKGFDVNTSVMDAVTAKGGQAVSSAVDAAESSEIVITMLPNSSVMESVYLGESGLIAQGVKGKLFIDCSTIDPSTSRKVAAALEALDGAFLDAPVSGGIMGAQAGTLCFMVGGREDVLSRANPVFECMGKKIIHAGGPGSGQLAKICNNLMAGILMAGTAEALALGAKNGLSPKVLSEVMVGSSGGNFMVEKWNPWPNLMPGVPASNNYHGGFHVKLMLKDLGLAIDCAQDSNAAVPLGAAARNLFALHGSLVEGNELLDISSIQKLYFANIDNYKG
ncbi:3-hydroxyisobutyrate dehydrogenase [Pseudomonas sp. BN605]|uniref:3-hydroxyisobutyrate dehydrogenase n=1 Tax=Pseudomonas hunanensis TaxID=1247546 RepID=A0ABD6MXA4_9PSED|nr:MULTISPECIES: 3-hydroxyisobutyrate dehydrogenase [Pseudomonas]MDH4847992.1 3-hydroxyisobutyrate dehydrogenase [Pseudomonas sp. BN605]NWL45578.1 3-hydroxyisobutyrate dehydrogenase [Pseudomonas hunanensis]